MTTVTRRFPISARICPNTAGGILQQPLIRRQSVDPAVSRIVIEGHRAHISPVKQLRLLIPKGIFPS